MNARKKSGKGPGISIRQKNTLLRCFIQDMMAWSKYGACASKEANVNRNTADFYYRQFREAIYRSQRRYPKFFGEVEIDQKAFGGRGRKRMQSYLRRLARTLPHAEYLAKAKKVRAEHKIQVMGILHRGGDVFAHAIKKNDANTIMPLVRLVIEIGSTVYTDKWRGFSELGIDGYTHHSINHSLEYMDKQGNHSNSIESFWSFAQRRLAKFNGIPVHTLPLHIKECEFRFNHREDFKKALKAVMK